MQGVALTLPERRKMEARLLTDEEINKCWDGGHWSPDRLIKAQDAKTLKAVGEWLEKRWETIETRWALGELAGRKHDDPLMKHLARMADELKCYIEKFKRGEMPK